MKGLGGTAACGGSHLFFSPSRRGREFYFLSFLWFIRSVFVFVGTLAFQLLVFNLPFNSSFLEHFCNFIGTEKYKLLVGPKEVTASLDFIFLKLNIFFIISMG